MKSTAVYLVVSPARFRARAGTPFKSVKGFTKHLLSRRLREIAEQNGRLSVKAISEAHSLYPDRYPDYPTFRRVLGGIMNFKRKRARECTEVLEVRAQLK